MLNFGRCKLNPPSPGNPRTLRLIPTQQHQWLGPGGGKRGFTNCHDAMAACSATRNMPCILEHPKSFFLEICDRQNLARIFFSKPLHLQFFWGIWNVYFASLKPLLEDDQKIDLEKKKKISPLPQQKGGFKWSLKLESANQYHNCDNIPVRGGTKASTHFFLAGTSSPDTFYTRHLLHHDTQPFTPHHQLLHQTPFTPDTFYSKHLLHQATFYTKHLLHQTPFTPDAFYTRHPLHQPTFTPGTFYTKHLLHQTPFTRDAFYTKDLLHQTPSTPDTVLHQTPFTPDTFHTKHLLHQTTFTPDNFHTRHFLHQPTFTPVFYFYTNQLLHQVHFTPTSFYTRHLLHQTPFTPNTFYTRQLFTPNTFYTRHLSHQTPFTPDTLYTNRLLHQAPFTPNTFYTRHLLHETPFTPDTFSPDTCHTKHFLHQTTFTPDNFYTKHRLHQTPFTPDNFYTRHLLHQTPFIPGTSSPDTFYSTKNTTTKTPPQKLSCLHHHKNTTPAQTDQAGCGTPGRQTRVDSSLWPQSTVPKLPSGTNGCQTLKRGTLNTSYFCHFCTPMSASPLPHTPLLILTSFARWNYA